MMDQQEFLAELEALHHPPVTLIEEGLRDCWELRPELHGKILTGAGMADYIRWMIENFGENDFSALSQFELPAMLLGGNIAELGKRVLRDAGDIESRHALTTLYESPQESRFFLAEQDISVGAFLRYLPPYWRRDEYFEVYYVFSGTCRVFFEKESITLRPGSVLIVPPEVQKACTCMDDESAVFFYMIRKSTFAQVFWSQLNAPNLMANFFRQALSGESKTPYLRFETGQDLRLESLLFSIFREYNRSRKYSAQLLNSLMSSFFLCLLQEYEDSAQISRHSDFSWKPEYAEILSYLQERFSSVTLEELSERFGYSRRQLIRIIQASTGSSFTTLQTQLRMEKAARMLSSRTASVDDIALEVGFTDRSSFYRAFNKYFGCTPKEFINQQSIN